MPNYQSRSEEGGAMVGGAMDILSQYEANAEGDPYSAKNPSNAFLGPDDKKSLDELAKATGAGLHTDVVKKVLHLTPVAHHSLVKVAKGFHKGSASKTHAGEEDFTTKRGDKDFHEAGHDIRRRGGPYADHILRDIASSKDPHHLARMVDKDKELAGGAMVGGDFLGTLGNVASTVGKFLPFLL